MKKTHLLFFVLVFNVFSIDIPSLYQCHAIQLIQDKNGNLKSKSFGVQSLFIKFNYNQINVYGIHSGNKIYRSIDINRIFMDTVFLKTEIRELNNKDFKFYMSDDTLIGNYDLLNNNANQSCIKILVTKIGLNKEPGIKKQCN